MAKAAGLLRMALVLLLLGAAAVQGLDVVKTRLGWDPESSVPLEEALETVVVRGGEVAPSFAAEYSGGSSFSFLLPSIFGPPRSLFFPFVPRLYEEDAQQSLFFVRSQSPVEVTSVGVVDGLGATTRTG